MDSFDREETHTIIGNIVYEPTIESRLIELAAMVADLSMRVEELEEKINSANPWD